MVGYVFISLITSCLSLSVRMTFLITNSVRNKWLYPVKHRSYNSRFFGDRFTRAYMILTHQLRGETLHEKQHEKVVLSVSRWDDGIKHWFGECRCRR
ncbi:hypothetical protein XNC1_3702 [Xenorhabdus nematophila ATCC 19061]|uniref:Uncharacterized protein n=1 Tax=Xenorhabdus nematophila (strain ATCC 19061 / DSM 3370 / CCUG 14189 / LMG 1036 / NCIMB 9965 / AN6) TaxID=406817 RepID=D3VAV8_XENNA|nr:hypothetical protein XNC1_3702 [Xenorhabdus nematophila ATCC 19061]CEK24551.1 hypothetical protein XNC2_3557 [Xenorhabdus nematophila AN6/1]